MYILAQKELSRICIQHNLKSHQNKKYKRVLKDLAPKGEHTDCKANPTNQVSADKRYSWARVMNRFCIAGSKVTKLLGCFNIGCKRSKHCKWCNVSADLDTSHKKQLK